MNVIGLVISGYSVVLARRSIQRPALEHSHEAARFGDGPDMITIRKVDNGR